MELSKIKFSIRKKPYFEYFSESEVKKGNRKKGYFVRTYGQILKCSVCQKEFFSPHYRIKNTKRPLTCSYQCAGKLRTANNNPNWRGGRYVDPQGYIHIRVKNHPLTDSRGYVCEHRYLIEQNIGRKLESWEVVHHKNRNRQDNRIENLELVSHSHSYDVENGLKREISRLKAILSKHNILFLTLILILYPINAFANNDIYFNKIVDSIYKAEGSELATKPFGILSVPCSGYSDCRKIAYNTVKNTYTRWLNSDKRLTYLEFLAKRYCPVGAANDPQGLNRHWLKNVMFFMNQKENSQNDKTSKVYTDTVETIWKRTYFRI